MAAPGAKVRQKQPGQVKRRAHPYPQGIVEFLIGTVVDPLHQRQGIVDQIIHLSVIADDLRCKAGQSLFIGQIASAVPIGALVYDADGRAVFLELLRCGFPDPLRPAGDYRNFVLEHAFLLSGLTGAHHEKRPHTPWRFSASFPLWSFCSPFRTAALAVLP